MAVPNVFGPADPREAYNLMVALDKENIALRALLDRAEKALEPFAVICSRWDLSYEGEQRPDAACVGGPIPLGNLRLARTTLEEIRKGKG